MNVSARYIYIYIYIYILNTQWASMGSAKLDVAGEQKQQVQRKQNAIRLSSWSACPNNLKCLRPQLEEKHEHIIIIIEHSQDVKL